MINSHNNPAKSAWYYLHFINEDGGWGWEGGGGGMVRPLNTKIANF